MAGLGYIDHSDVETILGITLSGTSKPFTDTEVDAICDLVEDYGNAYVIAETRGRTLADCPNTGARDGVLKAMAVKAYTMLQGHRAGVSSETSSDGTSATYAIDWTQLRPELRMLAGMASAAGKVMQTVKGIDITDMRKV